jgi:hypothetical protein
VGADGFCLTLDVAPSDQLTMACLWKGAPSGSAPPPAPSVRRGMEGYARYWRLLIGKPDCVTRGQAGSRASRSVIAASNASRSGSSFVRSVLIIPINRVRKGAAAGRYPAFDR